MSNALATTTVDGILLAADKVKLDSITANAADRSRFQFGNAVSVPGAGTLQLGGGGAAIAGVRLNRAGTITGASIQVSVIDAARAFNLSIRVNGVQVATVALPVSTLGANSVALAAAVVAGDVITAFLVRTAGAGASTFNSEQAMVEVTH